MLASKSSQDESTKPEQSTIAAASLCSWLIVCLPLVALSVFCHMIHFFFFPGHMWQSKQNLHHPHHRERIPGTSPSLTLRCESRASLRKFTR